jgi:(2R)-sulfolactate sulfo-lyase subunit alpha
MIHFLVHDKTDTVGVAVVDIKAGELAKGVTLDDQTSLEVRARMDIALGHKLALRDFKVGDTVTKYGQDIGRFVAAIENGERASGTAAEALGHREFVLTKLYRSA